MVFLSSPEIITLLVVSALLFTFQLAFSNKV